MPRVLVFTPTYEDGLQPETVASIEAMQFDRFDWVVGNENPHPGRDMRNVAHQFHRGRRLALESGYDALLTIEHDMIVPFDALVRLWATDAGVVYGCYQFRHRAQSINLFRYEHAGALGMSLSLYPQELRQAQRRGWAKVSGAGFGCLLIRRDVLAKVPFRDTGHAPDLPFARDCVTRGIQQVGRTDVRCGHIDNTDAKRILWPFEEGILGMIANVVANQNVTIADGNKSVPMVAGQHYSISVSAAQEAQRAGYVTITSDGARETATVEERETATASTAKRKARR